jgi:hypothetical protein
MIKPTDWEKKGLDPFDRFLLQLLIFLTLRSGVEERKSCLVIIQKDYWKTAILQNTAMASEFGDSPECRKSMGTDTLLGTANNVIAVDQ